MTSSKQSVLFVDLDGTLIHSDLLLESLLRLLGMNFFYVFLIPIWLLKGRANLKHQIASRVDLRVALLPYNHELIAFLEEEDEQGRELVLISASNQKLVSQVADHVGMFNKAIGSSATENLKGAGKLRKIQELMGEAAFAYAGDGAADLHVWTKAEQAIVVNGSASLLQRAQKLTDVAASFASKANRSRLFLSAMRPHQWLKNTLLFLPLALSHNLTSTELLQYCLLGFLSFGLCASGVYLLNDLLDLDADRQHSSKCSRPFAAGTLPLSYGFIGSPLLILSAFLIAALLPRDFIAVLAIYFALTLLYNFYLKSAVLVDVLTLAALYTLRIIGGAALISVVPTFWLLAFSMFLFLSLAIVKRYTELDKLRDSQRQKVEGRGYLAGDLQVLAMMGSSSGFMAILVFALYINDSDTRMLYATPELLWLLCPLLLYLISRIWLLANRGLLHEDPVVFAITDHRSQWVVLLCGLLVWAATASWF